MKTESNLDNSMSLSKKNILIENQDKFNIVTLKDKPSLSPLMTGNNIFKKYACSNPVRPVMNSIYYQLPPYNQTGPNRYMANNNDHIYGIFGMSHMLNFNPLMNKTINNNYSSNIENDLSRRPLLHMKFPENLHTYSNTSTNANSDCSSVKEGLNSRKYSSNSIQDQTSLKFVNNCLNRNPYEDVGNQIEMKNNKQNFTDEEFLENHLLSTNHYNSQTNLRFLNSNGINQELQKSSSHTHLNSSLNVPSFNKENNIKNLHKPRNRLVNANSHDSVLVDKIYNYENTEILNLKIQTSNGIRNLSLCRFDDIFAKIKCFCESNMLSENYIEPIVNKISVALDSIYELYNSSLSKSDAEYLNSLYEMWRNLEKDENRTGLVDNQIPALNQPTRINDEDFTSISLDERFYNSNDSYDESSNIKAMKYYNFSKINKSF